jgi:hypothetical protein
MTCNAAEILQCEDSMRVFTEEHVKLSERVLPARGPHELRENEPLGLYLHLVVLPHCDLLNALQKQLLHRSLLVEHCFRGRILAEIVARGRSAFVL